MCIQLLQVLKINIRNNYLVFNVLHVSKYFPLFSENISKVCNLEFKFSFNNVTFQIFALNLSYFLYLLFNLLYFAPQRVCISAYSQCKVPDRDDPTNENILWELLQNIQFMKIFCPCFFSLAVCSFVSLFLSLFVLSWKLNINWGLEVPWFF